MTEHKSRDHGGGLDAAIIRYGGTRADWLDLSTGINPAPYKVPEMGGDIWTALPDRAAITALERAARRFWQVPDTAAILAAPGASSLIVRIPALCPPGTVRIDTPTYNEHAAAFTAGGWQVNGPAPTARVVVHPNNPDGRFWGGDNPSATLQIIDESFCDIAPTHSHIARATTPGTLVLKSFGKFWGLAGLRLGFAIGDPALIAQLTDMLGPWPVSGPALSIGTAALTDETWASTTRTRLAKDSDRLDTMMHHAGAALIGGTSLFRLYDTENAASWQAHLAQHHIWSRIFPYSPTWLRLGLPHPNRWRQIETAINTACGTVGGATSPQATSARPSVRSSGQ